MMPAHMQVGCLYDSPAFIINVAAAPTEPVELSERPFPV
jgi:hypothetical protein